MIYLDNAATSYPKPRGVYAQVHKAMKKGGGNASRGSHSMARAATEAVYSAREAAGELFNCKSENVVLTYNATHALNLAIKGLAKDGCHILMSDLEHNAVRRPIIALCRNRGCSFDVFSTFGGDADLIMQEIRRLVKPNTKMLVCTHVSNICNITLPVREISKFCRDRGIVCIIDASQSAGHLSIDFNAIGASAICMPGHKGLYGPQGTGLLLSADRLRYNTVFEGGSGVTSEDEGMPEDLPERLEAGTIAAPLCAGLAEGINWVNKVGTDVIHRHESELAMILSDYLHELGCVTQYDDVFSQIGGTVLFNVKGVSPSKLGELLDREGICVRSGLHCAPLAHRTMGTGDDGAVRVSFGYFNHSGDVRALVDALYRVSKQVSRGDFGNF